MTKMNGDFAYMRTLNTLADAEQALDDAIADGDRDGMTQCIKIPDQGETYELYAPAQKDYVSCVIKSSESLNLEELRGRWVIARLQRCNQHKRKLVLEALPSQLRSKEN